jgi:branched-subunit amino acid ABC-type transport system permease component
VSYLTFLLLGLGSGGVYAALGIALVLTYRSSGTVNFATGAIAMYVAYTYALLRQQGALFDPILGLPPLIHIANHIPTALAMVIALAVAGLLGLIFYLLICRPLRSALPLSRVVASVGLMVLIQTVVTARLGTSPLGVSDILPSSVWHIGKLQLPENRPLLAAVVVAIAIALWALMRFTRFGLVTRAVAESEKGAILVGISTNKVAASNWALAAMVAGLSGILISPVVPIVPSAYTLLIGPALAAALVGRFASFGPTVATGLALGMFQSLSAQLSSKFSWYPQTGTSDAFVLLIIIGLLVIRGERLPGRGALIRQSLPKAVVPQHVGLWTLGGLAGLCVVMTLTGGQYRSAVMVSLIMAIVALSWVIVTGYVGQISLAQLALAGVAGFMLSRLTTQWGVPFPLSALAAALAAAVVGAVVGLPALRVRGVNLAIVTMAAAIAIGSIYFTNPSFDGGSAGAKISGPTLFGLDLRIGGGGAYPRVQFGYLLAVFLCIVAGGVANLRRSRLGSQMLAVRANERAAAAGGINVAKVKLTSFAIGAFIAGLGGALLGFQGGFVSADNFGFFVGLTLFAFAYLAGIATIAGGIVAGLITPGGIMNVTLDRWVNSDTWLPIVAAILLIFTAITNPGGFVAETQSQVKRLVARLRPTRRPVGASVRPRSDRVIVEERDTAAELYQSPT